MLLYRILFGGTSHRYLYFYANIKELMNQNHDCDKYLDVIKCNLSELERLEIKKNKYFKRPSL